MPRWLQGPHILGAALLTLAAQAGADQVVMRTGGRIDGVVVDQTPTTVVVEMGLGRVTLPMARVERIVKGPSALETWRERSSSLRSGDVQGWAALARWAGEAGLSTQASDAWNRVLFADPRNLEAHRALGHVQLDGAWLPEDEAYRARGYMQYEGRWVSLAEHEALVRERLADEAAEQQRYEADLRAREAEARAREAEARASQAEAAGMGYAEDGGIPFYLAYGGGGYPYGGYRHHYGHRPEHGNGGRGTGTPHPAPRATTQATSLAAASMAAATRAATQPARPAPGLSASSIGASSSIGVGASTTGKR